MSIFKIGVSRSKPFLIVLGWGACFAGFAITAILAGVAFPRAGNASVTSPVLFQSAYYLGIFVVSFLAGYMIANIGKSLLGFLVSYTLGLILTGVVLLLPWLFGSVAEVFAEATALNLMFAAFFPIPLFLGILGAVIGAAITEL